MTHIINQLMYESLDGQPESYPFSYRDHPDQAVFYHVEAGCGTLPCPPYSAEKELIVCSVYQMSSTTYVCM